MSSKILAIYDSEITYADLLTKQLLRIPGNRIEIRKFTDIDKLISFSKENMLTYLLISEKFEKYEAEIDALSCYILTEQKEKIFPGGEGSNKRYIFRYQSVNTIYECISGQVIITKEKEMIRDTNIKFQFMGLYNPVRRCGQTTFAKAIARVMGQKGHRVLYINMDEMSEEIDSLQDFERMGQGHGDLGDIIYFMKQTPLKVREELHRASYKGRKYDTLAPVEIFTELTKVTKEDWLLFMEILKDVGYDTVILDLDSKVDGFLDILEKCDKVYLPKIMGKGNEEKEMRFINTLKVLGYNQLLIAMDTIEVPEYSEDIGTSVERNLSTQLGLK